MLKFLIMVFLVSYLQPVEAQTKIKLTPFQSNIEKCFGDKLDFQKIDSSQKLYKSLSQKFSLQTSETLFREVKYKQKGSLKKLKYENGLIQIFSIDDDENLELISSEKFTVKAEVYGMRHKISTPEAKINQLLFQADLLTDFQKTKETRSKQILLEIAWQDNQIKALEVKLLGDKKSITCNRKETADICTCSI